MYISIRNFVDKDLSTLVHLLNETHKGSYEFVPYEAEEIRSYIQERNFEILLAEGDSKVLGATAYVDGHWGEEIRWLAVPESPDRKTIEAELVKRIEKCVKGETVFTGVDAESPEINEWIERGYRTEGGLYHMVARLDRLRPLPSVTSDIFVRSLRTDEEKEFVEVVNAGFGWERIKTGLIQRWKSDCPLFSEEWISVAEFNKRIISVVASRPDVDYNEYFGGKRGYLGPATTLPEFRSKHLASVLTQRAMNFLFQNGMDSVALHTSEQNVPSVTLLKKLGFEIKHHWRFMRKNLSQKVSKKHLVKN